jgi:hypothetical protein
LEVLHRQHLQQSLDLVYGPWANIKIYDKFTNQIAALLEDTKYRKVLSGGILK